MSTKTDLQIHLWLFGKSKGDLTKKFGERAPREHNNSTCLLKSIHKSKGDSAKKVGKGALHENDNSKGASNQRREAGIEVHV
jgi:hypothetical protein